MTEFTELAEVADGRLPYLGGGRGKTRLVERAEEQFSRYENGKSEMGAEVLLRISRRFGKSMEWVLTGDDG